MKNWSRVYTGLDFLLPLFADNKNTRSFGILGVRSYISLALFSPEEIVTLL